MSKLLKYPQIVSFHITLRCYIVGYNHKGKSYNGKSFVICVMSMYYMLFLSCTAVK